MHSNVSYKSGILLHPTSLPGRGIIGEIGPDAYRFIDDLSEMGQSIWQILPIGPVDRYSSPYSSSSTFAGNELLISLDLLTEDCLLDYSYLDKFYQKDIHNILFSDIHKYKLPILRYVSENFDRKASLEIKSRFDKFCLDESYWLDGYARFCALKNMNNNKSWINWDVKSPSSLIEEHYIKITQFIFHDQWNRLRKYCKGKNIKIIGDMPIYVGYDSADVYTNQNLFQLDDSGEMEYKAGCPPCEYQKDGQVWGNPLYQWTEHENTNFEWWRNRFKKLLDMVDIIRLDHFIGYERHYRIPINDETAINGEWIKSPGEKLFSSMESLINKENIIAEDLGDVTTQVTNLRDKYKYQGMRVLQFDFEQIPNLNNSINDTVVYTGTHDNDTILGWFNSLTKLDSNPDILTQEKVLNFLNCSLDQLNWEAINYAMGSSSQTCIIPMQDVLSLESSSRFNTPGTLSSNNWSWRMKEHLDTSTKSRLMELTKMNNRKM